MLFTEPAIFQARKPSYELKPLLRFLISRELMFSISRLVRMQVENTNKGAASKYRTRSHDLAQETWHFPNFTTNNRMNERSEMLVNAWNTGSIVLIPSGINNPREINRNMLDMQEVLCASVHRTNLSLLPARR